MKLETVDLKLGRYAVRPEGCFGTHGWQAGVAWTVVYVNAINPEAAVNMARRVIANPRNTIYMPMRAALNL